MYKNEQSIGKITSGIAPNTFLQNTINFVYSQLPSWRDDPNRTKVKSENTLNLQLCKYLNTSQVRELFPMVHFVHEEYQKGHASVDISACPYKNINIGSKHYTYYDAIVVFEGKRLPTPTKTRQKEYVTGFYKKSGAIQRFKLGIHGNNHRIVAIIGYVQKEPLIYWFNEINAWISSLYNGALKDNCNWNDSEILTNFNEDLLIGTAICQSIHNREHKPLKKITIKHLWIAM